MAGGFSLSQSTPNLLRPVQQVSRPARQSRSHRLVTRAGFTVRPYTIRKGDNLSSIAKKRDINTDELIKLNHDIPLDNLTEGQTILLPANKLSARDREILEGIGTATYRTYPVRVGETLEDITSKRKITFAEMAALNPDLNLTKPLPEGQILKLPANKYTVREREMMIGSGLVPAEFFRENSGFSNAVVFAFALAVGGGCVWLWRSKQDDSDDI